MDNRTRHTTTDPFPYWNPSIQARIEEKKTRIETKRPSGTPFFQPDPEIPVAFVMPVIADDETKHKRRPGKKRWKTKYSQNICKTWKGNEVCSQRGR